MFICIYIYTQEVADNNCVYRNEVHHSAGERTQILQDVASDPTLPRTKAVRCAVCNHGEAVFFQVWTIFLRKLCCVSSSIVRRKKVVKQTNQYSSRSVKRKPYIFFQGKLYSIHLGLYKKKADILFKEIMQYSYMIV